MKVLVTGSNGLLGQKLIDLYLTKTEDILIATSRGENRHPVKSGYIYESMDIGNQNIVDSVIDKHKPDVVINTAAMTNVDACEHDHEGCDLQNVEAVSFLVEACNRNGSHLVHLSTDFIFDGTHGPLKETEEPFPLSYYGNAKLKGEQIVQQQAKSWAILRTVLVYGIVDDMSRSNIVLWAKNNLEKKTQINVVDDQFRTPTLAEDLAIGCSLAASQKAQGIFNISGKDFMSVYDLVLRVAEYWQLDKSVVNRAQSAFIKQPAKRPPITGFIIDKAKNELGYNPRSFEEGLEILDQQLKKHSA